MNLSKRDFLQVLASASAAGLALGKYADADAATAQAGLYDVPTFGNVSLLHMTDCHAQLKPIYFREPNVNLGLAGMQGQLPHLVGEHLLKKAGVRPGTPQAHAYTYIDFEKASRRYGKVGGFAHLATLVKKMKASRPGALLLDGGDTWQGSATALWTNAQDMVDACKLLGVNPVFKPYVIREINGVPVAIVGQAFPYTPIANPRYMVADWAFGIQDENMQKVVDEARAKGAKVVVVISHNGMDVDLKMASRVRGIDAIFGGHTHDGVPVAVPVKNAGGTTLVTNAGSNSKFLGVMDFDVKDGKVADYRYRLLPVFANQLQADPEMDALITKVRAPYLDKLNEKLAVTDGLLYRRGNFNGSWDQLLCDALMDTQGADMAFSPGFRWGTSLLPGDIITRELMMDQVAITYPYATLTEMSGEMVKTVLEDVADNLFNPDPYYQQGGDMVRVGGLAYTMTPGAGMGSRISDMRLKGKPIEAGKKYKVAGWAPVSEEAKSQPGIKPVWEHVESWLKAQGGHVKARKINTPTLVGTQGNPGIAKG
jgi:sulfur-oxidizing protein SoxB